MFQKSVAVVDGMSRGPRVRSQGNQYFHLSIVKLSHPEQASERRNAVAPSGVYEFGVTAGG